MTQDLPITPLIPGKFMPDLQPGPVKELANFIRTRFDLQFDMNRGRKPDPECGSAGCIGGFALAIWGDEVSSHPRSVIEFSTTALAQKLKVSLEVAGMLCFHPESKEGDYIGINAVTRDMAIATLERLAATGVIYFDESEK